MDTTDRNRSTPEARLLDAGWDPPPALRTAIERREALRAAIDALRTRTAEPRHVLVAFGEADRDGIITAIAANAIANWLDSQCQNLTSELTSWSATAEQAVLDAVYAAPEAVLASLEGFDAPHIRAIVEEAATPIPGVFDGTTGQPLRSRPSPLSRLAVIVAR